MPTLQFKGRNIIWNHHLTVPYHTLDEDTALSFDPKKGDGNIIVEGDNLTALKALLPQYAGKIDCIYIDPPYNTGNDNGQGKGWVYNDNVNSPLIKEWLNKAVGTDDLTKHDKWLCMMVPRLKMLKELLSEKGAIFISTDNKEVSTLRLIMDEIFGEQNFIGVLIWRKKEGGGQADQYFVTEHEYITAYKKSENYKWQDEEIDLEDSQFNYEDDNGKYKLVKLAKWGNTARKEDRPKMHFPIKSPEGKKVIPYAPDGSLGRWRVGKKKMQSLLDNELVVFKNNKENKLTAYEKIYFNEDDIKVIKERSVIYELASTGDGSKKLTEIFDKKDTFENPKPVELISWLLAYNSNENSIILDSFAGSGTTGQAVLELNKEDGGNRKFILVQMTEATEAEPDKNIARDITAERIKRAITKYDLNSGFTYYKLGTAIDAETLLQGDLPTYEQFAKYVFYLCTGQHHSKPKEIKPKDYFVGNAGNTAIYLIYEQDFEKLTQLALNLSLAEKFRKASANKPVVVYAPACFLDEEYLQDFNMQFVSIPYNLFQKNEQP